MKVLKVPKFLLNPISLPGMGRSIEMNSLPPEDAFAVRNAYGVNELFVEFDEEPSEAHQVINLWPDPHDATRLTLFIK